MAVASCACWIILIGFLTALFSQTLAWLFVGIFMAALNFATKLFKIDEELFKDWVDLPDCFHCGSIIGILIFVPIVIKALYVRHTIEQSG